MFQHWMVSEFCFSSLEMIKNDLRKCFVQLKLLIWGKKITSQAEVFILLLLETSFFVLIKVNVEKIAKWQTGAKSNVEPCCG